MQDHNLLERLVDVSPGMEVWWDSSPLIFDSWCRKMLAKADPGDREVMRRQFARMYDPEDPGRQLFRGVTTNPILSLDVIKDDERQWRSIAADIVRDARGSR